jgi:hypothetical protein
MARTASWTGASAADDCEPAASLWLGRPKSITARMPSAAAGLGFAYGFVHRQLRHARHRRNRPVTPAPLAHEQRVDERVGREPRLADEGADGLRTAEPPRPARQVQAGGSCGRHTVDPVTMRHVARPRGPGWLRPAPAP